MEKAISHSISAVNALGMKLPSLTLGLLLTGFASAAPPSPHPLVLREAVLSNDVPPIHLAYYTQPSGLEMIGPQGIAPTGEMIGPSGLSSDAGRTWAAFETTPDFTDGLPFGYRRNPIPSVVDPITGRILTVVNALDIPGLDPDAIEPVIALKNYYLRYRVSTDAGRTELFSEPLVEIGHTQTNPFEDVTIGENSIFMGDIGNLPLFTSTGHILIGAQATLAGSDGELANPGGGTTYTDVVPIVGTWGEDNRINWEVSQRVVADPTKSTRGMVEPTFAEMPDGRILMIMRGSNGGSLDPNFEIPSYRWSSVSSDSGHTWTDPEPWTYDNGETFFSPSSMSQLVTHSSGRVFWVGNINSGNSLGNNTRNPLYIGEVNPVTLELIASSVQTVMTRDPGDPTQVDISHFRAIEDRLTGDLVLTVPKSFNGYQSTTWGTYRYRLDPGSRNSESFAYQYNGDTVPGAAGYQESGQWITTPTSNGDVLTFRPSEFDGGYFMSEQWADAVSDGDGWVVEMRLKIGTDDGSDEQGAFVLFLGDGASQHTNSAITIRVGQGYLAAGPGTLLDTSDNTDDFHTIRVAQDSGANRFRIWRDGVELASVDGGSHDAESQMFWGDGSGVIGGPTIFLDYIRFDGTGGYEPVAIPEPATAVMMMYVGLSFLCRRGCPGLR